jgi:hypothetical protein
MIEVIDEVDDQMRMRKVSNRSLFSVSLRQEKRVSDTISKKQGRKQGIRLRTKQGRSEISPARDVMVSVSVKARRNVIAGKQLAAHLFFLQTNTRSR